MKRQWLDEVQRELHRRKLPCGQIERLVDELRNHLADAEVAAADSCGATDDAMCERLGKPEELAQSAWENHLAAHYAVRHPLLAFLALPVPLCLLGWAVAVAGMVGVFKAAGKLPWVASHVREQPLNAWPLSIVWLILLLELIVRVLPPVVATLLCCAWSEHLSHAGRWRLVSCAAIAVVAGLLFSTLVFPLVPGQGRWTLGLGFPGGRDQLLQLLIPLLIGLWWTCRSRRSPVIGWTET